MATTPVGEGTVLGIVFSKDRALQLDACLASFGRHVEDAESARVFVIYAASSARLHGQYQEVARAYDRRARFMQEEDFRRQVAGLLGVDGGSRTQDRRLPFFQKPSARLDGHAASGSGPDCVLFLVDDALFVRAFRLAEARAALQVNPDALGFSLRLGGNTTHCYVLGREQVVPEFHAIGPGILRYEWTKADGDFGYPLEISSSMYRLRTIARLAAESKFADPNTLESQLALQARKLARRHPFMLCPERSVAFSAPLNRVQEVYENRAGSNPNWSTERLADRFEKGLRIDVAALDGFVPSACHQEVELDLEPSQGRRTIG